MRLGDIERQFRLVGLRAERDEVFRHDRARLVDDAVARKMIRELV
jgi:CPA1 family monovalent cation:H+ antiporter